MANANMPRTLSNSSLPQARYDTSSVSVSDSVLNVQPSAASSSRRSR